MNIPSKGDIKIFSTSAHNVKTGFGISKQGYPFICAIENNDISIIAPLETWMEIHQMTHAFYTRKYFVFANNNFLYFIELSSRQWEKINKLRCQILDSFYSIHNILLINENELLLHLKEKNKNESLYKYNLGNKTLENLTTFNGGLNNIAVLNRNTCVYKLSTGQNQMLNFFSIFEWEEIISLLRIFLIADLINIIAGYCITAKNSNPSSFVIENMIKPSSFQQNIRCKRNKIENTDPPILIDYVPNKSFTNIYSKDAKFCNISEWPNLIDQIKPSDLSLFLWQVLYQFGAEKLNSNKPTNARGRYQRIQAFSGKTYETLALFIMLYGLIVCNWDPNNKKIFDKLVKLQDEKIDRKITLPNGAQLNLNCLKTIADLYMNSTLSTTPSNLRNVTLFNESKNKLITNEKMEVEQFFEEKSFSFTDTVSFKNKDLKSMRESYLRLIDTLKFIHTKVKSKRYSDLKLSLLTIFYQHKTMVNTDQTITPFYYYTLKQLYEAHISAFDKRYNQSSPIPQTPYCMQTITQSAPENLKGSKTYQALKNGYGLLLQFETKHHLQQRKPFFDLNFS